MTFDIGLNEVCVRVGVRYVITKLSGMDSLPNFLTHCAPLRALRARGSSAKNGFFNTFFPLSHTFYFETRPSPPSKIKENAFGAHYLQLYRKNECGDPHFLFHDFNKDSASFW